MKLLRRRWKKEDILDQMNKVEKSLLDTDIISEIIKRANPLARSFSIAKAIVLIVTQEV